LRPRRRVEQRRKRRRHRAPAVERAQDVRARGRMELLEQRQDLAADETADGARVRRVDAVEEIALATESLGFLAPEGEQRTEDAVVAPRLDALRVPARDEAVEDRLDLVGRRVTRRAQPVGRLRIADRPQLRLARPARVELDDLRAELALAEPRVVVGVAAAE